MKTMLINLLAICLFSTMADASGQHRTLDDVLAAQTDAAKARFNDRHIKQTLEFFAIEPGMTLVEGLPGGGWYTKILLPYLGAEGVLIGADYAADMYPLFGFYSQEALDAKTTWVTDWTGKTNAWRGQEDARVSAFQFGSMPAEMKGTADVVFMVRALHNLARFENDGGYLTSALNDAFEVLKPGGIAAVVQHEARENMPDEWADGSHGYLKRNFVIEQMEKAGFVFEASTDINQNPADQPALTDIVWRLPPSYATSRNNPDLKNQMRAIGESNRMTLRFRKPGSSKTN